MGKSRFEGMEIAIREQAKIADLGANDKVRIETLEAQLNDIDDDLKQEVAQIKATPIDKSLLRKQAETDRDNRLKRNEMELKFRLNKAEMDIKQAEHDADEAYKQAKLDIDREKAELANLKELATAEKDKNDVLAKQEFDRTIASVDNTEKTIQLRIDKATSDSKKLKKDIEIQLRSLKAKNNVIEEQKKGWAQFYKDTVEISKQPVQKDWS